MAKAQTDSCDVVASVEIDEPVRTEDGLTMVEVLERDAYKRGAEAMREQCALLFDGGDGIAGLAKIHGYRDFIRSLPLPKDG